MAARRHTPHSQITATLRMSPRAVAPVAPPSRARGCCSCCQSPSRRPMLLLPADEVGRSYWSVIGYSGCNPVCKCGCWQPCGAAHAIQLDSGPPGGCWSRAKASVWPWLAFCSVQHCTAAATTLGPAAWRGTLSKAARSSGAALGTTLARPPTRRACKPEVLDAAALLFPTLPPRPIDAWTRIGVPPLQIASSDLCCMAIAKAGRR